MLSLCELNKASYKELNKSLSKKISEITINFHRISEENCINFLCKNYFLPINSGPIQLTDSQLGLFNILSLNKHVVIPKTRQAGVSFSICLYLTKQIYYHHKDIAIVTPNKAVAFALIQTITRLLKILIEVNNDIKLETFKNIKFEKNLINLAYIIQSKTDLNTEHQNLHGYIRTITDISDIIGWRFETVYYDEAAFINNIEELSVRISFNRLEQIILSSSHSARDRFFRPLVEGAGITNDFVSYPMIIPNNVLDDLDIGAGF